MRQTGGAIVQRNIGWPAQATDEKAPFRDWSVPPVQAEPSAKLRELLRAFLRRRKLIFLTLLVLNAISFVAVHMIKPRYTAEATLIIGPRQAQVLDLKAVLSGLSGDSEAIESEVQMLRSRRVARSVVQQLHLDENPEFNPPPKAPGLMADLPRLMTVMTGLARTKWNGIAGRYAPALMLPETAALAVSPDGGDGTLRDATDSRTRDPLALTIDNFLRHLAVTPKGHSRVVSVSFDSNDPSLAAAAANEVVNTYIADQLNAKREATASAHKWLEDRVAEMREQVINADQAVAAYRRRAGITQGRTGTLLSEQISTLGEQAVQARITRSNAEARLQALQNTPAASRRLDSLPEVQGSVVIQGLRAQESTLLAQAADLSRTYGEQHPRVAAARAAAGAVEGRIASEIGKIAGALQDEVRTAQAREAMLSANLASLRRDVDRGTESEVELSALQHEAEANRALYDRLLARSRETNVEGGLQQPDAQVISAADAPDNPSFPNPVIILPIFFLASCIATVLLVFTVEFFDNGFSSLEQVEATLGVAALGVVPRLKRGAGGRRELATYQSEHAQSAFGEAVRSLHTSLMLSSGDQPPKVVLISSAMPGEGRSSVVLSLARLMASCGKRVVVVDCDLRRPALHKAFGGSQSPGLIDCLSGKAQVFDVLQCDVSSPAYLVAAGSKGWVSPDLFASEEMRKLVATLSDRFDLVLLNSSPVLAVSDTRNLCQLADKTVFVVRWQDTRRFAVVAALRQVLEAGGSLAGVLLSMVDLKQYSKHSITGFYQRRIGLYLSE